MSTENRRPVSCRNRSPSLCIVNQFLTDSAPSHRSQKEDSSLLKWKSIYFIPENSKVLCLCSELILNSKKSDLDENGWIFIVLLLQQISVNRRSYCEKDNLEVIADHSLLCIHRRSLTSPLWSGIIIFRCTAILNRTSAACQQAEKGIVRRRSTRMNARSHQVSHVECQCTTTKMEDPSRSPTSRE